MERDVVDDGVASLSHGSIFVLHYFFFCMEIAWKVTAASKECVVNHIVSVRTTTYYSGILIFRSISIGQL